MPPPLFPCAHMQREAEECAAPLTVWLQTAMGELPHHCRPCPRDTSDRMACMHMHIQAGMHEPRFCWNRGGGGLRRSLCLSMSCRINVTRLFKQLPASFRMAIDDPTMWRWQASWHLQACNVDGSPFIHPITAPLASGQYVQRERRPVDQLGCRFLQDFVG